MNKKILLSGGIMAFVAAAAIGGTIAAWTSAFTVADNEVSTATVSLIEDNGSVTSSTVFKPITAANILPGWSSAVEYVGVRNDGTVPLAVTMDVENMIGNCGYAYNLQVSVDGVSVYNDDLTLASTTSISLGTVVAGDTVEVSQQLTLDLSADNTYQNTSCTWDEEFTGSTI